MIRVMTAKYKQLWVYVCLLLCLLPVDAEQTDWTLAAIPFTVSGADSQAGPGQAVGELLPKLLLQQFATGRTHIPSPAEIERRRLSEIRLEVQKLFLEMSNVSRERDALVLLPGEDMTRKKKLADVEKKQIDIQSRLDEYIEISLSSLSDIKTQRNFSSEHIVLWKNSSSELFVIDDTVQSPYSQALIKKASDENVQGVITGSVTLYAGYMAVTARLYTYPGAIEVISVTEIGAVSDMVRVAQALTLRMLPAVLNQVPVDVYFTISPLQAAEKAIITFDTERYLKIPDKLTVGGGIHSVTIEAEGYETRSFTWDFTGASEFTISALMPERKSHTVSISVPIPGTFWIRGIEQKEAVPKVSVNSQPVLGLFVPDEGMESFFYITDLVDSSKLSLKPNIDDLAAQIERKRKWMYTSYTALLLSLPVAFFCYGTYINEYNGWALNRYDGVNVDKWKLASDITMGCSVVLGVNLLVQLGIYLYTANKVIPAAAHEIKE